MDQTSDNSAITIQVPAQSELLASLFFWGGAALMVLLLLVSAHLRLPFMEKPTTLDEVLALGLAALFALPAIPTIWRMVDRCPLMVADAMGVRLHPSCGVPPLTWDQISGADLTEEPAGYGLNIVLTVHSNRRIRSWLRPLGQNHARMDARSGSKNASKLIAIHSRINAALAGFTEAAFPKEQA